jgi:hypothetical protein
MREEDARKNCQVAMSRTIHTSLNMDRNFINMLSVEVQEKE